MLRRLLWVLALLVSMTQTRGALAQAAAFCQADQAPGWDSRLAPLAERLGAFIGAPIECPHQDTSSGDTLQTTTTGLAYVRAGSNTPIFTNGQDHVALTNQGLTGWDGPSSDAPLQLALPNGTLPIFCNDFALSSSLADAYLCSYPNNSVAAWGLAAGATTWDLLGTQANPESNWSLTAAGQAVLGSSLTGPSAAQPGAAAGATSQQTAPGLIGQVSPRATGPGASAQPPSPPQPAQPPVPSQPQPNVPPPIDSDLQVSLNPVSPSADILLTGSACNRSTFYTAENVEIDFAFSATAGLSTTPDHAAYNIDRIAPSSCQPIATSINTLYPWQSIEVSDTRVQWQRAS